MFSVSQIPAQLLGIHPGTASYMDTHTYVIDTLLCHGGGAPGSAGWAAKRKIHCSARSLVRGSFCTQCCHDRRGLSKRGTESYIHLERATVRLSRTECQYTIHESCSWGHAVSIVFSIMIPALISFAKSAPRYMPLRQD